MADIVSPSKRSQMMAGIRAKNTKPETQLRQALHLLGFRYRLHVRALPGCPDIVLPKYGAVIFVHGCFWHGHGCRFFKLPSTRTQFWTEKIAKNRESDSSAVARLRESGWRVAIVWECSVRGSSAKSAEVAEKVAQWLRSERPFLELIEA